MNLRHFRRRFVVWCSTNCCESFPRFYQIVHTEIVLLFSRLSKQRRKTEGVVMRGRRRLKTLETKDFGQTKTHAS